MATRELTKAEADALTKEMMEVLEKHGAEMGVIASIQLLKTVEEPIPSPFQTSNGENPEPPTKEAD